MNTIKRLLSAIATALRFEHGRSGTFVRIFGLWLALKPWGNCFSPAIILNPYKLTRNGRTLVKNADGSIVKDAAGKPVWQGGENAYTVQACSLTFRSRNHTETTFYWYGRLTFGWHSAHIARWFGQFHDTDFGGIIIYNGWLGHHNDL